LQGFPAWQRSNIMPFFEGDAPQAAPSFFNAEDLGILTNKDKN
jgi:hypothetical protein